MPKLDMTDDLAEVGITEEELAQYEPSNIVIHPGEYIREDLEELGWSASKLARARCPDEPDHGDPQRSTWHYGGHGDPA